MAPLKRNSILIGVLVLAALVGLNGSRRASSRKTVSLPPVAQALVLTPGKARVVKVSDGDTLQVQMPDGAGNTVHESVRLYGIDAPETRPRPGVTSEGFIAEPYAADSSQFLENLTPPGSDVALQQRNRDRYGRVLAVVILPDGRDANKLLLEAGMARVLFMKKQMNDPLRDEYERIQADAQTAKRGIWK